MPLLTWARVAAVLRGGNIPASNSARPIIIMKTSTVAVVIHDVSAGLTHPSISTFLSGELLPRTSSPPALQVPMNKYREYSSRYPDRFKKALEETYVR